MAANTTPIFLKQPRASWTTIAAANTAYDGTGTVATIFTADATNGSKIEDVFVVGAGTSIATVIRFFVNNGSTNTVASNNTLVHEESVAAITSTQTAATTPVVWRANLVLPAGYKLNCTLGSSVAGSLIVTAIGGDF
jgi:hypothetical protein